MPPGQKSFWMSTTNKNVVVADREFSRHGRSLFMLRQAAVDLGRKLHQRVCHLDRIRSRPVPAGATAPAAAQDRAQRAPGFRPASAGREAAAVLHDQLDQRLAGLVVALERQDIAGHPAIRSVPAPHLLAPRPRRLAGRTLAPRQPGVFLKLVGAVERRHVGRGGQAGADAEAVDRRAGAEHVSDAVFVEPAACKDRHLGQPTVVEDAADALGQRDEIAAVEAHARGS